MVTIAFQILQQNIIREPLINYTREQYKHWGILDMDKSTTVSCTWNSTIHQWEEKEFPQITSGKRQTLLVPKVFVGKSMLSSPGELLQNMLYVTDSKNISILEVTFVISKSTKMG